MKTSRGIYVEQGEPLFHGINVAIESMGLSSAPLHEYELTNRERTLLRRKPKLKFFQDERGVRYHGEEIR